MINKFITYILGCLIIISFSCVKEAPTLKDTSAIGAYLTFNGPIPPAGRFDYSSISSSSVSINVKGVGSPIDKVNIYVGTSTDRASWKLIKSVPFSDSATLSVNGAELAKALGVSPSDLTPGNAYTFYNEIITKDGRSFSASNTSADFQGQNSYKMALTFQGTVFCSFSQSAFNGSFKVVSDGWGDFKAGDLVAVMPGPGATQITIIAYPAPQAGGTNRKPMVLDVDPATNAVTVKKQIYGDYPPGDFNVAAEGTGSVNSCSGSITLSLTHSEGGAVFGTYTLILQK